jgi:hypothetical protein
MGFVNRHLKKTNRASHHAPENLPKIGSFRGPNVSGKPGNLFDPKGHATRAEVAAMLHRFALAMDGE